MKVENSLKNRKIKKTEAYLSTKMKIILMVWYIIAVITNFLSLQVLRSLFSFL